MRLSAWRETFLWLAISACGPARWTTEPPAHPVSVLEVPLLANATFVGRVGAPSFGDPEPRVQALKGTLVCEPMMMLTGRGRPPTDPEVLAAQATCPPEIARQLMDRAGFLFLIDAAGPRWLTTAQVLSSIAPIDTPAKAVLAAWVTGHEVSWSDGHREYGRLEDGRVRAVTGGYEVATGAETITHTCGARDPRETVTRYRVIVFVAGDGTVTERSRTEVASYDIADPCHPAGRRPEDFLAHASDGSVPGLIRRALHDEAESVRAFERIARELAAHGAPAELIEAAAQAARDERAHAARCAALLGEPLVIATDALPVRPLLACALDNAREGCVGETYAALAAVVQARDAESPELRAHFAAIAVDELAHAALAHALADWFESVLSPEDRDLVRAARSTAAGELRAALPEARTAAMRALGMPAGARARHLLDAACG